VVGHCYVVVLKSEHGNQDVINPFQVFNSNVTLSLQQLYSDPFKKN
jgi:hypothetical protein